MNEEYTMSNFEAKPRMPFQVDTLKSRILQLLLSQRGRKFTVNEIAGAMSETTETTRTALEALVKRGSVLRGAGKPVLYSAS